MKAFRKVSAAWIAGLALSLLTPVGCVQQSAGHEQPVTLKLVGDLSPRIAEAFLTLSSIELEPCEEKSVELSSLWQSLTSPWVSTAMAHTGDTALRIGSPKVVAVHGPAGERHSLGVFRAPTGSYCGVRLELSPADADADGLSGRDGGVGETLRVRFSDGSPDLRGDGRRLGRVVLSPPLEVSGEPRPQPLDLQLDRAHWDEKSLRSFDSSLGRLVSAFETS